MYRQLPLFFLSLFGSSVCYAEILFDPHTFLTESSAGSDITFVAGVTATSDTDYEISDGFDIKSSVSRKTLDFGAFYGLQPDIGLYGSLLYDMSADAKSFGEKGSVDGFQLAIGGFRKINDIGAYPTILWAELNLVRESAEFTDTEVVVFTNTNISETYSNDFEGTELTAGILFQVLATDNYTVSSGAELIAFSDGKVKDSDGSSDVERSDRLGLKGIAQYKLNQSTYISAYLKLLNETKIGITASLAVN